MMHTKHRNAAYRAANAAVLLVLTAVVFVNRRIQKWMMTKTTRSTGL